MDSWSHVIKLVCCDTARQCEGCFLLCQWEHYIEGVIHRLLGVWLFHSSRMT